MTRTILTALTLIASAGCASFQPPAAGGMSVQQAYNGTAGGAITIQDAAHPLSQKKRIPVITAPEVFGVYVTSHVDPERDMLVGEHWLFVKLRDSAWFTGQSPETRDPQTDLPVEQTVNLEPGLHSLGKVAVPYETREVAGGK